MRSRSLLTAALVSLTLAAFPAGAVATPVFSLRVEAPGQTLDPGTMYAPRSPIGAPRGETPGGGDCVRGPGRIDLAGRNALGLIATASNANKRLRPLWVVEDGFGRRLCRVAGFAEADAPSFTGWLYRVNHVAPPLSAELAQISKGDEVLWVFADFGSGVNTGDELVLEAPVRAVPGPVQVGVKAIGYDGTVKPAPDGTVISGGIAAATTSGGVATVSLAAGTSSLRATGPGTVPIEIPSASLAVCVAAALSACPAARPLTLVGTNVRDSFKGAAGPDVVRARGGRDKIRVRGGGADVVDCGRGRDLAIVDAGDRTRRCEKVRSA